MSASTLSCAAASDGERFSVRSNNQDWLASWHSPDTPPQGTPHGSAGVCVTADGQIVLISHDGVGWDVPAGRPEQHETDEETLCREMLEEACATVVSARLLGFCRSECIMGPQVGLVLVRSFWRADVTLAPWQPQFEIQHRLLVDARAVMQHVTVPAGLRPIVCRALHEAALLERG